MTSPAPYNRELLARLRQAESDGQTLEAVAQSIGWSISSLESVCRNNHISLPRQAAAANGVARRPAARDGHRDRFGGLEFETASKRIFSERHNILASNDVFALMRLLAECAPQTVSRSRLRLSLFRDLTPQQGDKRLDLALDSARSYAAKLDRTLVVLQGQFVALGRRPTEDGGEP